MYQYFMKNKIIQWGFVQFGILYLKKSLEISSNNISSNIISSRARSFISIKSFK